MQLLAPCESLKAIRGSPASFVEILLLKSAQRRQTADGVRGVKSEHERFLKVAARLRRICRLRKTRFRHLIKQASSHSGRCARQAWKASAAAGVITVIRRRYPSRKHASQCSGESPGGFPYSISA